MLSKVISAAITGIDAYIVEVEVDVALGLPKFSIVGLPDAAVKESKDRVRSALKNAGFDFPSRKVTVNLAPASVKKEGPSFDLPIAFGLLAGLEKIPAQRLNDFLIIGELALESSVRSVRGILSIALAAKKSGKKNIILPFNNVKEAAIVEGISVYPIKNLSEGVRVLKGECGAPFKADLSKIFDINSDSELDFIDVKGQENAKRALEVACAGGHNVLMVGPPGAGKTMLARRVPTILPTLLLKESIEVTRIHSLYGNFSTESALITSRPFRTPHHTISNIALIGGGTKKKPGEVSLSHYGVLFLDEFPEFRRDALESLRQPLEDGIVTVSRASGSCTYPAEFMLIAAMNPCPCGFYSDPLHECQCGLGQIQKYRKKISGPILDRIDIQIEVPPVRFQEMGHDTGETSSKIKRRVELARKIQHKRFGNNNITCNARMSSKYIKKYCRLDEKGENLLKSAVDKLGFSARAINKVVKVARTIADMDTSEDIKVHHIAEAIQYRSLDRSL